MFRRVDVENFKSLANTSTELGQFTVLVGNNGSGKSSFLQALELASWAVRHDSLNDAMVVNHVDFRDLVYLRAPHSGIRFYAELEVARDGSSLLDRVSVDMRLAKKRYVYIEAETVKPVGGSDASAEVYGIESAKRVRRAWEGQSPPIRHENVALGHSMLRDVYLLRDAKNLYPVLYRVARHFMSYIHYEIWGPESLRKPTSRRVRSLPSGVGRLGKRGDDLPALLWRIRQDPERWQKLMKELQRGYPGIEGIHFKRGLEAQELGLVFDEQPVGSHAVLSYRPPQMSDGFMRLLALLAVKYQPIPLKLIGYEEPENGLHPSALDYCMRHLKDIARGGTQVIVTTHSPYLLNYLLEDETDPEVELRLVLRGQDGKTRIAKPDPEKVARARRQGFGIGELWGMLLNEKDLAQI